MINRRTSAVVMVMFAMVLTLELSGHLLRTPPSTVLPLHMFVWFMCTALYTILLDRRFWVATLLFLPSFTWACIHPEHVFHMMFVGALGVFLTVAFAWMRPREDANYFVQQMRERHDRLHEKIKGRASRFPKAP
jgi:hypothetical protein